MCKSAKCKKYICRETIYEGGITRLISSDGPTKEQQPRKTMLENITNLFNWAASAFVVFSSKATYNPVYLGDRNPQPIVYNHQTTLPPL